MNDICHDNPAPSITDLIRQLNDRLRIHGLGGRIMLTSGVLGLDPAKQAAIANAIRTFTDFNEDNDPHGQHDFAVFTVDETEVMFKIDCFDKSLSYLSTDPADESLTIRVMTIMLASEY